MTIRFALAALLAASALSPSYAQVQPEGPGEPTPIPEAVMQAPQAVERLERPTRADRLDRQPAQPGLRRDGTQSRERGDGREGGWQRGGAERAEGRGWQRWVEVAPQVAVPTAVPQVERQQAPTRRWQLLDRERGDRNGQARQDWQRQRAPTAPQAAPPVVQAEGARGGWRQDRQNRRREVEQQRGGDRNWQGRPGWNDRARNDRTWNDRTWNGGQRWGDNRGWDRGRSWQDNRSWNRSWRNDNRYDWQRWRFSNRNLFRARPYDRPYGWNYGYRRFGLGVTLWTGLYDRTYWIDDPWSYRLPEVYGAYRWVRYYDDVLLVDVDTGRVVDVIHDFFW